MSINSAHFNSMSPQERAAYLLRVGVKAEFSGGTSTHPKYTATLKEGNWHFGFLGEFDSEEAAVQAAENWLKDKAKKVI